MDIQAALLILLMLPAAVKSDSKAGSVTFWRDNVTLTCPGKAGSWFGKFGKIANNTKEIFEFKYEGKGKYHCEYEEDTKYYFYVMGKTCKNCYELDAGLVLGVLTADIAVTVILMVIVYKCTKRRHSARPAQSARAAVPSGGRRAPPVPSPDYQQLNPRTRSHDTYSPVNRTG